MRSGVSGGGCRPVTPGEGGACGAGRRQRGSGQAAARAAQSPGVERRGRGETYTGPPGPAQCRRRGLHGLPPPRWALAVRPALLQVTLAAGEKLQEEGAVWRGGGGGGRPHAGGPRRLEAVRSLPSVPWPGDPPQGSQESWGLRYPEVRREGWRSGSASPALPASWNCPKPQPSARASRGGVGLASGKKKKKNKLKEKFGSSRLPAGPQRSPAAEAERDGTPGRWLSRGFLLLARLGRVWVPRSE